MLTYDNQVLAVLFLTCLVYAIVLEGFKNRYIPDWLIFTVIIGCGFIWEALAVIEHGGIPLTSWLVLKAMFAAGIPIGLWQIWQFRKRRREARDGA